MDENTYYDEVAQEEQELNAALFELTDQAVFDLSDLILDRDASVSRQSQLTHSRGLPMTPEEYMNKLTNVVDRLHTLLHDEGGKGMWLWMVAVLEAQKEIAELWERMPS